MGKSVMKRQDKWSIILEIMVSQAQKLMYIQ